MTAPNCKNVREIVGHLIGLRVVDITQHDEDEYNENGQHYVMVMFEGGHYLKFFTEDDGFFVTSKDTEPEGAD